MGRSGRDDLELLSLLLMLPREVLLDDFEPATLPGEVVTMVRRMNRGELQSMLIEVLAALRPPEAGQGRK
ncbi:hypothetical protein [Poriferisphaera sp. WC338]|uniref:hypothetical protein n=1 Tax=Poriferisphaera sp. WC338 TaxID=3425129 RepID=UPI003D815EA3